MFTTEKELAVEVTEIDSIEIDDVDLAESCEYEVFEQLTTDATSADEENARLLNVLSHVDPKRALNGARSHDCGADAPTRIEDRKLREVSVDKLNRSMKRKIMWLRESEK